MVRRWAELGRAVRVFYGREVGRVRVREVSRVRVFYGTEVGEL